MFLIQMANQSSNKPTSTNLNPQIVDSTNLRFPRGENNHGETERIPVLGIGFFYGFIGPEALLFN